MKFRLFQTERESHLWDLHLVAWMAISRFYQFGVLHKPYPASNIWRAFCSIKLTMPAKYRTSFLKTALGTLLAFFLTLNASLRQSHAFDFHLGGQDAYGISGSNAEMNVTLIKASINNALQSIQFTVGFDSKKANFVSFNKDPALSSEWTSSAKLKGSDSIQISLSSAGDASNREVILLGKIVFRMLAPYAEDSSRVNFNSLLVNADNSLDNRQTAAYLWRKNASPRGDFNGDEAVDQRDVTDAFGKLVKGYRLSSTEQSQLEWSKTSPTSTYDVALLYSYISGLAPKIPEINLSNLNNFNSAPKQGELTMAAPTVWSGDLMIYTVKAKGITGLQAAELSFQIDASIVSSIEAISFSGLASLTQGVKLDNSYNILMASPLPSVENDDTWLTLLVKHKAGKKNMGLQIQSAYLNEGRIIAKGIVSKAVYIDGSPSTVILNPNALIHNPRSSNKAAFLNMSEIKGSGRLILLAADGRKQITAIQPEQQFSQEILATLSPLSKGALLFWFPSDGGHPKRVQIPRF